MSDSIHVARFGRALRRACLGLVILSLFVFASGAYVPSAVADGERDVRENAVVRAVRKSHDAIVSIRTNELVRRPYYDFLRDRLMSREFERDGGLGSGAIFHPDGYIITNAHVISRASNIEVHVPEPGSIGTSKKKAYQADAIAVDIPNDLAIIRLLPQEGQPLPRFAHLQLGRSNDLMLGESVIAVGNPFRLGTTVTRGIISALNREVKLGRYAFRDFIQVDAAINPGNSGGPLFDVTGRWIGVNTAIYTRMKGAEGIGFAIPIDRVRRLIARTFKRRTVTETWLGLDYDIDKLDSATLAAVYPKGPASGSGLMRGDRIVTVNGKPTPTLFDLRIAMLDVLGGFVSLGVERDGKRLSTPLRVAPEPVPTRQLAMKHLGLAIDDSDEIRGVIVTGVRPGGPASRVKVQPRDIITEMGNARIESSDDLLVFLQHVRTGDLVEMKIERLARSMGGSRLKELTGALEAD